MEPRGNIMGTYGKIHGNIHYKVLIVHQIIMDLVDFTLVND